MHVSAYKFGAIKTPAGSMPAGEYYNLIAYTVDEIFEFNGVDPSVDIDVVFTPSP